MKLRSSQSGHAHLLLLFVVGAVLVGAVGYRVFLVQNNDPSFASTVLPPSDSPKTKKAPSGAQVQKQACNSTPHGGCFATVVDKDEDESGPKAGSVSAGGSSSATVYTNPVNPAPLVTSNSTYSYTPPSPPKKPEVNIAIYTYVKDGDKKSRLGAVKVNIKRNGGNENCNNRKQLSGSTNATHYNSQHKLVRGTLHFVGCTAGTYTVTTSGRSGYTVISDNSKTVNLSAADQTAKVRFVLEKKTKKSEAPIVQQTPEMRVLPSVSANKKTMAGWVDIKIPGKDIERKACKGTVEVVSTHQKSSATKTTKTNLRYVKAAKYNDGNGYCAARLNVNIKGKASDKWLVNAKYPGNKYFTAVSASSTLN